MFELEAALITAKCVMEVEVNTLKLLRFLLKVTKRNNLRNRYIQRKIGGKARDARFFFNVKRCRL